MSRFGKEHYRDEDSWGERTSCDARSLSRQQDHDNMGVFQAPSSEDVCNKECAKWEREWRRDSLAAKGLRDFDGTGEGAQDGVAFTEAMYEDQVTGINMGNRRK